MSLQKRTRKRRGLKGMSSYVLSSTNNNHACKRRRDADFLENESSGSSEKLAQEVMVEEAAGWEGTTLIYSLLMTSNSSIEHELDFKTDSFDLSQHDVSLVQFCIELFSFINV